MSPPRAPYNYECQYMHSCPHLDHLPAKWFYERYKNLIEEQNQHWGDIDFKFKLILEYREYVRELESENADLKAKLQALQGKLFKANKKAKEASTEDPAENKTDGTIELKKRGAPIGHPGWYRKKPDKVDATIIVEAPEVCPHCSSADLIPAVQMKDHLQEDIILQPRPYVTNFKHHQSFCTKCNRYVIKTADGELANCHIGPLTKATAVFLRHGIGIPYRKVKEIFEVLFNMPFVPASAMAFDRKATELGEPLYDNLKEKLQASIVAHADETHWRQDGVNHYLWYAGNKKLAYYHIDRHRSSSVAESILEYFQGVLHTDGYAAYNILNPTARQACLAHLIRNANEIKNEIMLKHEKYRDEKSIKFCENIARFFKMSCHINHKFSDINTPRRLADKFNRRLYSLLDTLCSRKLKDKKAETFRKRLINPKKEYHRLFTFLYYPEVQPTNNQAEQSLRNMVIFRKICFGTRSQEGSYSLSVLQSLVITAKRQGKHPLEFLKTLFSSNSSITYQALYQDSS